ncbi:MAG: B12-binding domain-containing radical SAM protein [Acidimicrobiales bacterium]|nr:B12-binding domain-containing radical SAM protein [Acidimicrobiales bacterium]
MRTVNTSSPVCLIRPPAVETFRFSSLSITPPLGLAYIAGAVEAAGHTVEIVDAVTAAPTKHTRYFRGYLVGSSFDEIADRVPADAKAVGITVVFTHEWPAIVRLVEAIKARYPDVPVILGGEHVSSMPEFCLLTSQADALVMGEGEETVIELLDAIDEGRPFADILGVAYRERTGDGTDGVVVNPRRERRLAIDDIARPAWHLIDLDTYHEHRWMGGMYSSTKSVPILATRGCPYQCTYCSAPNMWTPRWIPRDPKKVVDEIEHYIERFGARNFPFQDLTAIIKREWVVEFCEELLARGLDITWQMPTGTRSEAIDPEVAQLLKKTNMISMAYAPESGSETTRQLIKKKMKTDRMLESMRAAVDAELNVMVFMVIGFPHDTDEHLRENLTFLEQIAEVGINDAAVGFYMALPGTQIFDSLYDSGQITLDREYFRHILSSTSLWATSTYSGLSRPKLTYWKFRMLRHFYRQPRQLVHSTSLFTTVMQALKSLRGDQQDETKLQSAFRNGVVSALDTLRTKPTRGWMSRRRERRFFDDWDAIYRDIRANNLACGAALPGPADTTELHKRNVTKLIKGVHGTKRRIPVSVAVTPEPSPTPAATPPPVPDRREPEPV